MTSEYREGAPGGQDRKRKRPKREPSEPLFTGAEIRPHHVYSTAGAAAAVGVSEEVISSWKQRGLEYVPREDIGSKQDRIMGIWILRFLARNKTRKE